MSSYFVNSFSGRYPNGPDYQLLNYGASGGAMNGGAFRDSSSATMHHATGSYGYGYNGMDLTVTGRGGGSGGTGTGEHFGGASIVGDSRSFGSSTPERSFRQASSCSLAPAADSLLTPGGEGSKLGAPSSSPRPEQQGSGNLSSPNLSSSASSSGGGVQRFTELDDASPDTDELPPHRARDGHGGSLPPRTGVQKQEGGPAGAAATGSDAHTPQIFPWMRKLHISHGTHRLRFTAHELRV